MEGHRYADDGPSWYSGRGRRDPDVSGSHAIGNPYDSGIHERPSGAFRLPEQRPADPYALSDPMSTAGGHTRPGDYDSGRIPVRGPEYPTIRPNADPARTPGPSRTDEPTSLVPPVSGVRQPERVYQTRSSVSSVVLAVVTLFLMIPVVRLLIDATFAEDATARAIVPAVLLTLGFTLTGIGLFAVARGGPLGRDAWLRPPVAYLPVGLLLLLAAGVAVA